MVGATVRSPTIRSPLHFRAMFEAIDVIAYEHPRVVNCVDFGARILRDFPEKP